jgi:hypothetical protein
VSQSNSPNSNLNSNLNPNLLPNLLLQKRNNVYFINNKNNKINSIFIKRTSSHELAHGISILAEKSFCESPAHFIHRMRFFMRFMPFQLRTNCLLKFPLIHIHWRSLFQNSLLDHFLDDSYKYKSIKLSE